MTADAGYGSAIESRAGINRPSVLTVLGPVVERLCGFMAATARVLSTRPALSDALSPHANAEVS